MAGHQDARYTPPSRERDRSRHRWRDRFAVRRLILAAVAMVAVFFVTFLLSYSRGQVEYTDEQRACIAQRYSQSDASRLDQCVDVCKACTRSPATDRVSSKVQASLRSVKLVTSENAEHE
jgi:hypothetical protein